MTAQEFDNQSWTAGMFCEYKGVRFEIATVDFDERLIGICECSNDPDAVSMKRCENIKLIS